MNRKCQSIRLVKVLTLLFVLLYAAVSATYSKTFARPNPKTHSVRTLCLFLSLMSLKRGFSCCLQYLSACVVMAKAAFDASLTQSRFAFSNSFRSQPTPSPTHIPTPQPTEAPTPQPTRAPTNRPTEAPTPLPTRYELS